MSPAMTGSAWFWSNSTGRWRWMIRDSVSWLPSSARRSNGSIIWAAIPIRSCRPARPTPSEKRPHLSDSKLAVPPRGPVVRPGILDIAPYVGGEAKIPGIDRVIKLSSNESALGPSPMAIRVQQACAADAHRYPDGAAQALRSALAEFYWLDPARSGFGDGSG